MSSIFLTLNIEVRKVQWGNPRGKAELTATLPKTSIPNLSMGNLLVTLVDQAIQDLEEQLRLEEEQEKEK